ncbi:hypothetical protein [uncultured Roseibium sp.]|uniref:hypothetical protein n=1 Tax=uncultured Roseibium sp. TaxID=1936171 RepID=UPI00262248A5|nr:hypothetical protein [uncultured Roseibium sp.]
MIDAATRKRLLEKLGFVPSMDEVPAHDQAPWPPAGGREYDVSTGRKSWGSIAREHNLDAEDLIYFNFETSDHRKINWYLHHYVGCWQSTDRRNFDFEGAFPGKIYVPPPNYDRKGRFLSVEAAKFIAAYAKDYPSLVWTERGIAVSSGDLRSLVAHLHSGKIRVVRDSEFLSRENARAAYMKPYIAQFYGFSSAGAGLLFVKDDFKFSDIFDAHTFIHEATHAVFWLKGYRNTSELENEVMARLAAELWHHRRSEATFDMWYARGEFRFKEQYDLAKLLKDSKGQPKVIDVFDRQIPFFEWTLGDHRNQTHAWRNPVEKLKEKIAKHYNSIDPRSPTTDPRIRYYLRHKDGF